MPVEQTTSSPTNEPTLEPTLEPTYYRYAKHKKVKDKDQDVVNNLGFNFFFGEDNNNNNDHEPWPNDVNKKVYNWNFGSDNNNIPSPANEPTLIQRLNSNNNIPSTANEDADVTNNLGFNFFFN